MSKFYTACLSGAKNPDCSGAGISPGCFACLATPNTASAWGAVILYSDGAAVANTGACYAEIGGSSTCAAFVQEETECEEAACEAACEAASTTQFNNCITSADDGECKTYVNGVKSQCGTLLTGTLDTECGGDAQTFEDFYDEVAQTLCE